jgi:hypothetical protein
VTLTRSNAALVFATIVVLWAASHPARATATHQEVPPAVTQRERNGWGVAFALCVSFFALQFILGATETLPALADENDPTYRCEKIRDDRLRSLEDLARSSRARTPCRIRGRSVS